MITVGIGAVLLAIGLIIIPVSTVQEIRQSETWEWVTTLVNTSSFSLQLAADNYWLDPRGGSFDTENPPYLEIWDSDGNLVYKIDDLFPGGTYFTIDTADNYHFYIYRWLLADGLEVMISSRSYQPYTVLPYTSVAPVGIIMSAAGASLLVYGLAPKRKFS